jgi:hypothetical protein
MITQRMRLIVIEPGDRVPVDLLVPARLWPVFAVFGVATLAGLAALALAITLGGI